MLPGCLLKERNVEMHNAMLSSVIFPRRRADFKIFQQLIPLPGDLLSSGSLLASPSPSAIEAARFLSGRALDSFKECGRLMCIGIGEVSSTKRECSCCYVFVLHRICLLGVIPGRLNLRPPCRMP
ncbi:hypothetical protein AAHE18_15G034200 [Arachis hypogaea]